MELTVLAVPGCPGLTLLERRLAEVLADHPGLIVTRRVIADAAEAARWGMHGSPTLLVDGRDPFAGPGAVPAFACRMYRAENGDLEGSPGVGALRRVLAEAGTPGASCSGPAPPPTPSRLPGDGRSDGVAGR